MTKATKIRYNNKRLREFEEYLGCEYYSSQYTGSHIVEIPSYTIHGVKLPNGKKHINPDHNYMVSLLK